MLKKVAWLSLAAVFALACGDDGTTGGSGPGGGSEGGTAQGGDGGAASTGGQAPGGQAPGGSDQGGMQAGMIPDPGPQMDGEWVDVEPNDTPSQAVPMGTLTGPIWAGFMEPYTAINPEDDVDYFVFKTGGDVSGVYMALCWGFPGNLLDMNLYEVVDQHQGDLVKTAAATTDGCETLIDVGTGAADLTPNTTYLLEVAAAPGLVLGGDEGLYGA
ncbi:MAG: hypothetical protein HOW73_35670 [Polyangiaceae bacterium]|nr:hypothetical protein [Polyangiaceae bacterium]